jgi:ZIP family zinc transporter
LEEEGALVVSSIQGYLEGLTQTSPVTVALIMSTLAMILTTLGATPILLVKARRGDLLEDLIDVGLGFSSGVMIVASFTSLLLPSIEGGGFTITMIGFILGAVAIAVVNEILPHEHIFKGFEGWQSARGKVKAAWLVAVAIIIHNLPEGYSIGVASAYSGVEGVKVGLAIGLQDMPEGLAVALPILAITGSRLLAILVAALSGFSEVITAMLAVTLFEHPQALYLGLSSAAGAMIYVVSHEAIPESHRSGVEKKATAGFFLGFIVMLYLDTVLG